jgi:EAL domain-containing protein (putative c-di-GMP-specific phosphodiesterase class I)
LVLSDLRDPPVITAAGEVRARVAVGYAISEPGDDQHSLLERATSMMHERPSTPPKESVDATVPALRHELPRAMSGGDIKPYVRPVVSLASGTLVGYRGSARWHHHELGLLEPKRFIDVVAESPLATVVDLFVARETAAVIALRTRGEPLHLYTPVSYRLIEDARSEEYLREIANAFFVQLDHVHTEVACPVLRNWGVAASHGLRFLRETGIVPALGDVDDAAALDLAIEHGMAEVRLSRTLTERAVGDVAAREACTALVARAHDEGIAVTASGVDTEQQCDVMHAVGCDTALGDALGGAQPAHSVD